MQAEPASLFCTISLVCRQVNVQQDHAEGTFPVADLQAIS